MLHDFKNIRSFDQITTLSYILMDNFCPCFFIQTMLREQYQIVLLAPNIEYRYNLHIALPTITTAIVVVFLTLKH